MLFDNKLNLLCGRQAKTLFLVGYPAVNPAQSGPLLIPLYTLYTNASVIMTRDLED
jgi:hypothetical protein